MEIKITKDNKEVGIYKPSPEEQAELSLLSDKIIDLITESKLEVSQTIFLIECLKNSFMETSGIERVQLSK